MKLPNLSEWALRHQQFVGFLIAVAVVMGAMSYLNLGRKEDPEFAVKSMLISVGWPGASATSAPARLPAGSTAQIHSPSWPLKAATRSPGPRRITVSR